MIRPSPNASAPRDAKPKREKRPPRFPDPGRLLLDINEVAAALGIGRRTAYLERFKPDFPRPVTLASRIVRYRRSDVETYVERLAADKEPTTEPGQLQDGKAAKRRSSDALASTQGAALAKPRRARGLDPRDSVEPARGGE